MPFLRVMIVEQRTQYECDDVPWNTSPTSTSAMKLLLTLCLTSALFYEAELVHCHVCDNDVCTNTTTVMCPATQTVCKTVTSVIISSTSIYSVVNKNCSSLLSCVTPLNIATEWSVNRGFTKQSHNQICCMTDNCNFQTLAVPNVLANGKVCPACANSNDSLAGTCNATVSCAGVEDRCFIGNITLNTTKALQLGCISQNLCSFQLTLEAVFGENSDITCGAPWSVTVSCMLLTFVLSAHKVLF